MTHTKGPWLYKQSQSSYFITDQDQKHIAFLGTGRAVDDTGHQFEANAHLIAAAPDLMAALEVIVKDWEGEPEDMFWATAALAKAKGETA